MVEGIWAIGHPWKVKASRPTCKRGSFSGSGRRTQANCPGIWQKTVCASWVSSEYRTREDDCPMSLNMASLCSASEYVKTFRCNFVNVSYHGVSCVPDCASTAPQLRPAPWNCEIAALTLYLLPFSPMAKRRFSSSSIAQSSSPKSNIEAHGGVRWHRRTRFSTVPNTCEAPLLEKRKALQHSPSSQ